MDQRIIYLYDSYTHGLINRRDFLDRLTKLAGSAAAAAALLPILQNNYAVADTIAANDPRLAIDEVSYDSPKGKINGYLARAKAKGKRPAVIVIHENKGLTPHIKDVTRRLAAEGFLALGLDLLTTSGGTPTDEDKGIELIGKLNLDDTTAQAVAAVAFLEKHAESTGKVGAIGFCWGGGMVNRIAVASPDLAAAVPYYGAQPPADKVPQIKAPLMAQYGGLDERINAGIPAFEAALKANNKKYQIFIYDGANHAFNNDTNAARYNKAAADLAWSRTLAFFKENLGVPPNAA
jgi:carboxymethylenebutenolidase